MEATSGKPAPRRGFTLIEMLAVVVIIGILAALITGAAIMARAQARRAAIKLEIDQLDQALNAYKAKFGLYPPDFTDLDAVHYHLAKAFPDCLPANYPDFAGHTPATALPFWLGGMHDGTKFIGFSANPENPFDDSPSRHEVLFDFDQSRLGGEGDKLVYYPNIGVALPSNPYVYFRSRPGGKYDETVQFYESSEGSTVIPYRDALLNDWVNPKKFQILCAGLDDIFGNDNAFKDDSAYGPNEYDNITNFSNITLEDELP